MMDSILRFKEEHGYCAQERLIICKKCGGSEPSNTWQIFWRRCGQTWHLRGFSIPSGGNFVVATPTIPHTYCILLLVCSSQTIGHSSCASQNGRTDTVCIKSVVVIPSNRFMLHPSRSSHLCLQNERML